MESVLGVILTVVIVAALVWRDRANKKAFEMVLAATGLQPTREQVSADRRILLALCETSGRLGVLAANSYPMKPEHLTAKLYRFEDLREVEVVVDGEVITKTVTDTTAKTGLISQLGRAAVGGMIAGRGGAAIGAMTAKQKGRSVATTTEKHKIRSIVLKVSVNDLNSPLYTIKLLKFPSYTTHPWYTSAIEKAEMWEAVLSTIIERSRAASVGIIPTVPDPPVETNMSIPITGRRKTPLLGIPMEPPRMEVPVPVQAQGGIADELTKLAQLKAQGILSDDEFAAQKKKLLG